MNTPAHPATSTDRVRVLEARPIAASSSFSSPGGLLCARASASSGGRRPRGARPSPASSRPPAASARARRSAGGAPRACLGCSASRRASRAPRSAGRAGSAASRRGRVSIPSRETSIRDEALLRSHPRLRRAERRGTSAPQWECSPPGEVPRRTRFVSAGPPPAPQGQPRTTWTPNPESGGAPTAGRFGSRVPRPSGIAPVAAREVAGPSRAVRAEARERARSCRAGAPLDEAALRR